MKELSYHILDILENSIEAKAKSVELFIEEDIKNNLLTIRITDNGKGIKKEMLDKIGQPFVTTKEDPNAGVGLYLFKSEAENSGGNLTVTSERGKGTVVTATFKYNSQYRKPLGNITECLVAFIQEANNTELRYVYVSGDREYTFDTKLIKKELGIDSTSSIIMIDKLKDFISTNITSN